jgi:outer membrane protein insertion porin family
MTRIAAPRLLALALASALALAPVAKAQNFEPFQVQDIRVDGLQRIAPGTVFTYLQIERGDSVDSGKAAQAIRALFKTGFFSDVSIERQGNILVVKVTERPAIDKLTLVGNKDIKTEELLKGLKQIGLAEGETFDRLSLDRVTQELNRQYDNRGKYNVSITPTVTPLDRNRVDITITIAEGKAARIRGINIVGNTAYTDKQLRDNWESNTSNWLSWYRKDDQYSREKVSGDLEKLNSYYLDRGYVDFNIDSTQVEISPDRRDMFLTANIAEGNIYNVSGVDISGEYILPKEDLQKLIAVKAGETFSRKKLEQTVDAMTLVLANIGYAFAKITPVPNVDKDARTVAIDFHVVPGPRVQVRRILFKGNTRTADNVLRREMRQFEGSWFSQAAVDRSRIRLQRLGYFDDIKIETPAVPGSNDQVDVVVNVKERNSGQFTFGLGYSQISGLITSVQLDENNFLGTGNHFSLAISNSSFQKKMSFTYLDPYFTSSGVSVGYGMFYSKFNNANFNTAQYSNDSYGGSLTFGVPITETDTVGLTVGVDTKKIQTIVGTTPQVLVDYLDAVGHFTFKTWSADLSWASDSRNSFFAPTRGTYQRLGIQIALPGSTQEYYKLSYSFERYWPLSSWFVLRTAADLGYGKGYGNARTNGLPFFENFYAGGVNSVRGFRDNTLGPVAFAPASNFPQPLGGSIKTVGSLETYFPKLIDSESARLSTFLDFGNVYKNTSDFDLSKLRVSAGVALQWRAPIGPIIISYAVPIRKEAGDQPEHLQFTFGSSF